ncbi:MAG: heavy-metal-associated domain-containing protein [Candidatus Latescibacteria bacterium]|nr:heavy-metal-associated domain-containing protein [Candidatus Latescibacterota bacterium]
MSQTARLLSRGLVLGALVATAVLLAGGPRPVAAQCCALPDHASAAAAKGSVAGPDSVCVLEISGMTCGACAAHVQKALSGVKDVKEAKVSYENKRAIVSVAKPSSKAKALVKAVRKAGYGARVTSKGVSESKNDAPGDKKSSASSPRQSIPSGNRARVAQAG